VDERLRIGHEFYATLDHTFWTHRMIAGIYRIADVLAFYAAHNSYRLSGWGNRDVSKAFWVFAALLNFLAICFIAVLC